MEPFSQNDSKSLHERQVLYGFSILRENASEHHKPRLLLETSNKSDVADFKTNTTSNMITLDVDFFFKINFYLVSSETCIVRFINF